MFRLIAALTIVAVVVLPSVAKAQTTGPRIITRHSVMTIPKTTYPRAGPNPVLRQFLSFGDLISRGDSDFQTQPRLLPHVVVIERPVVEPAAVVSRELANQPVHPHLIEVFLFGEGQKGSTTIYLDPDVDYEHQGNLVLDKNHSINRAQRSTRLHRARGPIVIRGNGYQPQAVANVVPQFIFQKPGINQPKLRLKKSNQLKIVRRGN